MAILLLVLFWVIVGLAVFAVAMRSGPRRVRDAAAAWRGERRNLFAVSLLAFVVFGIGLPAVVLATHTGNRTEEGPSGVKLTASEAHGRQLFAKNCATCHTLNAVDAVGKVGPNLDVLRPPAALVIDAVEHGRARGQGQMPANLLQGSDLRAVAAFVAKVAGR
jgi:mono/diheme cytochrome c family protein